MNPIKEMLYRIRGEVTTEKLISMGMTVGKNFGRLNGVILDPSHCWLITIGDDVTMAPRVHILCHDASTKGFLGYTDIGVIFTVKAPISIDFFGNRFFICDGKGNALRMGERVGLEIGFGIACCLLL